ncbi:hypothetical protein ABIB50_002773 [Mucilaginibacter sp. UYCu711]
MILDMNNFDVVGVNPTNDIINLERLHPPDLITDYMLPGLRINLHNYQNE